MDSSVTSPRPGGRTVAILAAVLSLPAAVVPFVSFTWKVSPLDTIGFLVSGENRNVFLLGVPFFLGIPIVLAWFARVALPGIPRGWCIGGAVCAACSVALSLAFFAVSLPSALEWNGPFDLSDFLTLSLPVTIPGIGGFWLLRTRRATSATLRATMSLEMAYLANASTCLIAFSDDRRLGWWLALVACIGIALDAALIVIATHRQRMIADGFDPASVDLARVAVDFLSKLRRTP